MKVKPYLEHLARESYVEGEPAKGQREFLDCSLGINPFGVSPKALEAAHEFNWSNVRCYPDPTYRDLRGAICKFWLGLADLEVGQIQIAPGASAALERLNKIFIEPGSKVLGYSPQFTEYVTEVEACGGKYEAVVLNPEEDFKFYVERLLARIGEEYCLIYIDNPNNPTGQVIDLEEIEKIIQQAKTKDVAVVVDEAYADYIGEENSAVNLMNKYKNLVVVRSFSKGFGLAGLRVGYGVFSSELSRYYQKINLPFSVSAVGCYLAREALLDQEFIYDCRARVQREKRRLIQGLKGRGYLISETWESCPIFVLGDKDKDIDLREALLGSGILTVKGMDFRNLGNNYVRVNTPAKAEEFLSRL